MHLLILLQYGKFQKKLYAAGVLMFYLHAAHIGIQKKQEASGSMNVCEEEKKNAILDGDKKAS